MSRLKRQFLFWDPAAKKLWRRTPGGAWSEWSPQPTMGGAAGGYCCAGLPDGSVIVLDQNVPVFRHWDPVGLLWVSRGHPGTIANWIRCVSAGAVDAVAVSGGGHVATYTGATTTWALLATFSGEIDVAENGALNDIWICQVGAGGEVKHYDGVSWSNHRAAIVTARGYDPGNTCRISRFGHKVFVTFGPYGYPFGGSLMVYDIPTLTWSVAATWGSGGGYAATGCWAAAEDVVYLQGPDGFGAASHAWKWTLAGGLSYIGYLGPYGGSGPEQVFGIDATRACTIYVYGNVIRETLNGTSWSDTSFGGACSNGQGSALWEDDTDGSRRALRPNGEGPISDWTASSGTKKDCVAADDGDTSYIHTSTDGAVQEFVWPATAMPTGRMVMAVRLVGLARATVAGATVKLSLRRGVTSSDRRSDAPRESYFTLGTSYSEIAIVMSNKPFPTAHGHANAWPADGSAFDDYAFGIVAVDCQGGSIRCTELRLEVVVRPEITLAEIVASERMVPWQWLEVEGIRWVPTTGLHSEEGGVQSNLPKGCGDYYYGFDYRPVAGIMLANEMFRSGRWNRARGREEFESARVVLLDVSEVAHEHDADGGDPPLHLYPQGFLSWLLAYGDRTRIAARRMLDTSPAWNSLKGLDPQWTEGTDHFGRAFKVATGATWPTAGGEDSYLYVGRECLWFGQLDTYAEYIVIGNPTTPSKLLRGRFGSGNDPHEWNRVTGVYPEVTDHPVSWNGRWVRLWTCYIDEATGYPFPMSFASARSYLWGSHVQELGPGAVSFRVSFDELGKVLDGAIPRLPMARCRRIVMAPSQMSIWGYGIGDQLPYAWKVTMPAASYGSISELCSALQDAFATAGLGTSNAFWIALLGDRVRINVKPQTCDGWWLACGPELGSILGFGHEPVQSSPDGTFDAKDAPASVHCGWDHAYVEEGDEADWPTAFALGNNGRVPGTTGDYLVMVLQAGDKKTVRECISDIVSSDGYGHHVVHGGVAPKMIKSFLPPPTEFIRSEPGEDPPTVRLGMMCADVQVHELFLRALCSTGFGTNGAWDVWPRGFGLGVPLALIDADSWLATSQEIKVRRSWFLFNSTKLSELLDEELAYPHGMTLRQDGEGRLQVIVSNPPSTSDVTTLIRDEHWLRRTAVREEHAARSVINHVILEVDADPLDGKFRTTLEAREPNSIDRYGDRVLKLKHRGERARYLGSGISSASPSAYFPILCNLLFHRFAFEQPIVSGSIGRHGLALLVAQGVKFSHALLQDITNRDERGIVDRCGVITKLDRNEIKGDCEIEIQYERLSGKHGGYAPAARVQTWTAGTRTLTCYAHSYSRSTDPTDPSRFAATDKAKLVQANDDDPSVAHVTIESVSGLAIVLTVAPGFTPADGDNLIWEDFDTLTTAQKDQGYVAVGESGSVDSGGIVTAWEWAP